MGCLRKCCVLLALGLPVLAAFLVQQAWSFWPELCCESYHLTPPAPGDIDPCEPVGQDPGRDLMVKGYTVVPNVIDEAGRKKIMEYANTLGWANYFSGYRIPDPHKLRAQAPGLIPSMEKLIAKIQNSSSIVVAAPDGSLDKSFQSFEFLTANPDDPGKSVAHIWHQDFEAYYLSQSTDQYLNMYLVIEKSDPNEGGLTITPFDVLKQRSKAFHDKMLGRGATSWTEAPGGHMLARNHQYYDKNYYLTYDMANISCSPRLVAGDLLILRGDTPHRTQSPVRAHRTTLSLRFSKFKFSTDEMFKGGMVKYSRMKHSPLTFTASAVASEFPEFLEAHRTGTAGMRQWPQEMQNRFWWLHMQIEFGYHYRYFLSLLRDQLGKWSGEATFPIIYY